MKKSKNAIVIILLVIILAIAALLALTQGSVKIPASVVLEIIMGRTEGIKASHAFIVPNVRVPRVLVSVFVGAILAVIGTVFQAVFRNPMADPYVMGVSSGAALGATIGIVMGAGAGISGLSGISVMALAGAMLTLILVYFLATTKGRVTTTGILLAGVVVSFIISSVISLIMILNDEHIERIVRWTMGSFNAANLHNVAIVAIPGGLLIIYLLTMYKDLNAMSLSEEEAKSLGVDVEKNKKVLLITSSILVALAVSVSGIIGFVGLIVPHFFRLIVGSNHRYLLPASVFGGALFMLICDTIARSFILGFEPPVGIITAIIGGPFFLILLQKHKRRIY